jgi:hypothetical protein
MELKCDTINVKSGRFADALRLIRTHPMYSTNRTLKYSRYQEHSQESITRPLFEPFNAPAHIIAFIDT